MGLTCAVPEPQTLRTAGSGTIRVVTEGARAALLPFSDELYRASAHLKWVHLIIGFVSACLNDNLRKENGNSAREGKALLNLSFRVFSFSA